MAIQGFTDDVEVISKLSDTPNDTLTAAQLKARFDTAGVLIKAYINSTLVTAINSLLGLINGDYLDIAMIRNGSITGDKLANGAVTAEKIANGAVTKAKAGFVEETVTASSDDTVPTSKAVADYVANHAPTRVFHVGTTAPEDTNVLWIDTANGLKYYNGSAWVIVPVSYFS